MPPGHGADVLPFLKALPLAPEYHPTAAEFQDPIAYILKIEPEASRFGICKIVPPLPAASKKSTLSHLSHSFSLRSPDRSPTFTTRHQQIGFCPRRPRPVQKPVWQSGDRYTLPQFQTKANHFHRLQLRQADKKSLSPLETETLFWRACAGRPFSVEYANDMPGSGFPEACSSSEARNVGESGWNMRAVSRARCSLLRFMKGEVPGVTSPMVYVGMMFSWFAWHVEDHDLHSLNYLHMGAGKTWYGVPRDAGLAFEDVIRVQGYGGEVNPLVTFAILGEKTTVLSPEVLIGAGIPCCRLVQNAGEFVVTFPGSYHSGFNHGFNCAEASNIATPKWLNVAKEAAVKRASTNYPPMVSHYQLLYALALSLCSRMPKDDLNAPRSSRLKCKMKGEGEAMVKGFFIENVIQNNNLLSVLLEKGSPCIVLPQNTPNSDFSSTTHARSHMTIKPRLSLGLCTREEALEASEVLYSTSVIQKCNGRIRQLGEYYPMEENPFLVCHEKKLISAKCSKYGNSNLHPSTSSTENMESEKRSILHGDGLLDKGLLSCVTCGILSFSCVAVIQPREAASRYLMSADCDLFNDPIIDSGEISDFHNDSNLKIRSVDMVSAPGHVETHVRNASHGNLADNKRQSMEASTQNIRMVSDPATQKGISALDLLASAYGDSSDSEEEELDKMPACSDESYSRDSAQSGQPKPDLTCPISLPNICSSNIVSREPSLHSVGVDCQNVVVKTPWIPSEIVSSSAVPSKISCLLDVAANLTDLENISTEENHNLNMEFVAQNLPGDPESVMENKFDGGMKLGLSSCLTQSTKGRYFFDGSSGESDSSYSTEASDTSETKVPKPVSGSADILVSSGSCCDSDPPTGISASVMKENHFDTSLQNSGISVLQRSQKDSSRMHVFCLEHAVEVERQLHRIGGVHIMLVCHPEYPKIEAEAKILAKELGMDHCWKDISYQEAVEEDQRMIRSALEDEKTIPMKGDWAVKLGINLYYSASLGKSPLYSKQLPYNLVIYKAFGRNSTGTFPGKPRGLSRRPGRKRSIVVAGQWCGKVWMSNQVHPYLAHRKDIEQDLDQNPVAETEIEEVDLVSSPTGNLSNNAEATRKSGRKRKRKKALLKLSNKRPKSADLYDSDCSEDVSECSSAQVGRVLHCGSSKKTAGRNTACEKASRPASRKQVISKKTKKVQAKASTSEDEEAEYPCDVEGCLMRFGSRQDLVLHRRNICPVEGCGKKLFSHKYLVQHQKVHIDDRPLKCPWKGCNMAFKWPWARTEHIRVHTGDRPYVCEEPECDQTFRFVSDFSRHKRKTGHSTKKGKRLMTNLRCQLRMS